MFHPSSTKQTVTAEAEKSASFYSNNNSDYNDSCYFTSIAVDVPTSFKTRSEKFSKINKAIATMKKNLLHRYIYKNIEMPFRCKRGRDDDGR